jgi:hypothetical protein
LVEELTAERIIIPLTATNIAEIRKISQSITSSAVADQRAMRGSMVCHEIVTLQN